MPASELRDYAISFLATRSRIRRGKRNQLLSRRRGESFAPMALFVCHALIKPPAHLNFIPFHSCTNSRCNWGFDPQVRCALRLSVTSHPRTKCRASESERVAELSKRQMKSTDLLAELLKTDNRQQFAQEHVDSLTEDFFLVSSTFMEMARKDGNMDMVKQIESALKVAMDEKGKTLRPEIQLLNQLLQQNRGSERSATFRGNSQYLRNDSYFFELLRMMTNDVEMQPDSPQKSKLLKRLQIIMTEADAISRTLQKTG